MAGVPSGSKMGMHGERADDGKSIVLEVAAEYPNGNGYYLVSIDTKIKGSETCMYPMDVTSGSISSPPSWWNAAKEGVKEGGNSK